MERPKPPLSGMVKAEWRCSVASSATHGRNDWNRGSGKRAATPYGLYIHALVWEECNATCWQPCRSWGMLRRMAVQVKVKLCVAMIGKFNRRRDLRESTELKFDEDVDGPRC
jgi:hypothetical protein